MMVNAKKGISSLQLRRDVKMARKTAWYLNHRIRKAMGLVEAADEKKLAGTVEADLKHTLAANTISAAHARKYDKDPVFGVVERDGRRARTYHAAESSTAKRRNRENQRQRGDHCGCRLYR